MDELTVWQWIDVIRRARLGRTTTAVAIMLATWADPDGTNIYPGLPTLAVACEVDYKTAKTCVAQLVSAGLLHPVPRRRGTRDNQGYRLTLADDLLDRTTVLSPTEFRSEAEKIRDANRRRPTSTGNPHPRTGAEVQGTSNPVPDPAGPESTGNGTTANDESTGNGVPKVQGTAFRYTNHKTTHVITTPHDAADVRTDTPGPRARDPAGQPAAPDPSAGCLPGCIQGVALVADALVRCPHRRHAKAA